MPINVTCPGCLERFSVAEKFAGKEGPCPNCKQKITIPSAEEQVVIHAPDDGGPKDAKGRSVLKTKKAKDAKFSVPVAAGVGVVSLVVVVTAFFAPASPVLLSAGAVVLGPILAWAGYGFLRDSELEPYSGNALLIRSLACGVGFAAVWGIYSLLAYQLAGEWPIPPLEIYQMLIAAGVAVGIGTFGSYVSLDLDPALGGVHCGLYLLVTIVLRLIMGLSALPGLGG